MEYNPLDVLFSVLLCFVTLYVVYKVYQLVSGVCFLAVRILVISVIVSAVYKYVWGHLLVWIWEVDQHGGGYLSQWTGDSVFAKKITDTIPFLFQHLEPHVSYIQHTDQIETGLQETFGNWGFFFRSVTDLIRRS